MNNWENFKKRFNNLQRNHPCYNIYGNLISTIQYPTGSQMILGGKNTYSIEAISYLKDMKMKHKTYDIYGNGIGQAEPVPFEIDFGKLFSDAFSVLTETLPKNSKKKICYDNTDIIGK